MFIFGRKKDLTQEKQAINEIENTFCIFKINKSIPLDSINKLIEKLKEPTPGNFFSALNILELEKSQENIDKIKILSKQIQIIYSS